MRTFQTVRDLRTAFAARQSHDRGAAVRRCRVVRRVAAHAPLPATPRKPRKARARELIELIGLARYFDAEAGILSYGQKKLVALAAALMPKPKIVVLDEPVAGVNPTRIREVEDVLRRLNAAGETFLIVEHNVEFITNLCDRVIVLDQGRKLAEGTAAEVHKDARVLEAYLGLPPEMAARCAAA